MATGVVERELRFDLSQGEVGSRRKTPQGGLIVDANISRTGVLDYMNPDGSRRRELRHPDDVFKKESLESFAHAPLTVDHPAGLVTPDSYLRVAPVGHVGATVAKDGKFVSAELHIQDAETIQKIEAGELRELSCGYTCKLVEDSGTYDGESHDARQTNIVGNHVAIGGKGWGRAGPEVRVHLDGGMSVSGVDPSYVRAAMAVSADNGATGATGSAGSAGATGATAGDNARSDAGAGDAALRGEIAVIKAENERLRADAQKRATEETEAKTQERIDKAVAARVTLVAEAAPILAAEGVKDWRADGKTDDAIKREVVAKLEPGLTLPDVKEDGAAAFVSGAYRAAVARADRAKGAFREMADVTGRPHDGAHADAKKDEDEDEVEDARQGLKDRMKDAWKPKDKRDREKDKKDAGKKDRGRK